MVTRRQELASPASGAGQAITKPQCILGTSPSQSLTSGSPVSLSDETSQVSDKTRPTPSLHSPVNWCLLGFQISSLVFDVCFDLLPWECTQPLVFPLVPRLPSSPLYLLARLSAQRPWRGVFFRPSSHSCLPFRPDGSRVTGPHSLPADPRQVVPLSPG